MKKVIWMAVCAGLMCGGLLRADLSVARADGGPQNIAGQTRVRIALEGPAIKNIKPEGHADFLTSRVERQLEVEAERVNLADGTVVSVFVNGKIAGMIKLAAGRGKLELKSKNGAAVPAIQNGDVVTVTAPTNGTILSGTF